MSETKYKVILQGGVQEGQDFDAVVAKLSKLVKASEEKIALLLKRKSTIIKKSIELNAAKKYQNAILACGAQCMIELEAESAVSFSDETQNENEDKTSLKDGCEYKDSAGPVGFDEMDGLIKEKQVKEKITAADIYKDIDPEEDKNFVSRSEMTDTVRNNRKATILVGVVIILLVVWGRSVGWPSYQKYKVRALLAKDFYFIEEVRNQVSAYIGRSGEWPVNNAQAGLTEKLESEGVEIIRLGDRSVLTILFREEIVGENRTLLYVPESHDHEVMWRCEGGDLENKYRPLGCKPLVNYETENPQQFKSMANDGDRARMVVPSHWTTLVHLSQNSELQAASLEDENYVMVIAQDKASARNLSVIAYGEKVIEKVFANISKPRVLSGPDRMKVDGKNATRYWVEGVIEGVGITYIITIIESASRFYQIFAWTLTSQLDENKAILKTVSDSFYEVDEV
jgi:type IV pilus assembly protein PilA